MKQILITISIAAAVSAAGVASATSMDAAAADRGSQTALTAQTATPIKHLVVIFNENVSFDHYFATYPEAANPPGESSFTASADTPVANTLTRAGLVAKNPNFENKANGADAAAPFRLDRAQAATADQNHAYTAEQLAYDHGKADLFPKYTGKGSSGGAGAFGSKGQVMGYYDGNTVTALWRWAQRFAMSDNAYTDTFGPSTPGMLEIVSGQTDGVQLVATTARPSTLEKPSYYVDNGQGGASLVGDVDPAGDVCSKASDQIIMQGKNIGDLLNESGLAWGSFMGGFRLDAANADGSTGCKRSTHSAIVGAKVVDYIPHHAWFQYFPSTSNPKHERPSSIEAIGSALQADGKAKDPANHNYDLQDFFDAAKAGRLPSVSYVKLPAFRDGHAGYSDPLDEQAGTVELVDFLQQLPDWRSTAVIVTWDDSDGWYDHAPAKATSPSYDSSADQLDGPGRCGVGPALPGLKGLPVNGRCGPGTRIPFLVISPWAKRNYVGHAPISLASVVRFIEDNWLAGQRLGGGSFDANAGSIEDLFDFSDARSDGILRLDPATGDPAPDSK
jgi:phospholipase C